MTLPTLDRVTDRALAADVRLVGSDDAASLRIVVQATYLLVSGPTSIVQADELDDDAARWLDDGTTPDGATVLVTGAGASQVTAGGASVRLDGDGRGVRRIGAGSLGPGADVAVETADAGTVATRLPTEGPVAWIERGATRKALALVPLLLRVDLVGLRLSIAWCARAPIEPGGDGVRVVVDLRSVAPRRETGPQEWDVDNTVSIDGTAPPPSLPLPFGAATGPGAASGPAPAGRSAPIMMLHVEPGVSARLRRAPSWRAVVQAPSRAAQRAAEEAGDDGAAALDARDAVAALRGAQATPLGEVGGALARGVDDGVLVGPLLVVEGEVEVPLDEAEVLRATVEAMTPLRAIDPGVKNAIEAARPFVDARWLDAGVAATERVRLRQAMVSLGLGSTADAVDAQVERRLRRERRHVTRTFRGARWVVARLDGGGVHLRLLVPHAAVDVLPVGRRFGGHLLVEVQPSFDPDDAGGPTLLVLALARDVGDDLAPPRSPQAAPPR